MKAPLISAVLASALFVMPALAVSYPSTQFEFDVRYDRAALDHDAFIAGEYERIQKQVTERCRTENRGYNPVREMTAVRSCIKFAMNDVIRSVDHDALTAYHRAHKSS